MCVYIYTYTVYMYVCMFFVYVCISMYVWLGFELVFGVKYSSCQML